MSKLRHPWWTHLPALGAVVLFIVYLIRDWPLPGHAATHFDASGLPNGYGSPWMVVGLTLGLSLLMIGISALLDELWARQERRKTFNWLSLLDEVTAGFMCGSAVSFMDYVKSGAERFLFPWDYALIFGLGAVALGVVLELMRPFNGVPVSPAPAGAGTLTPELKERIRGTGPFIFWSSQNPLYVTLLTTLLPLVMFAVAALSFSTAPWVTAELIAIGLLLIILYGGLRVAVTRQDITVRFGLFGLRVLRLNMADIASSEVTDFSPIRDFGGYGIRFNREMKAYYMEGSRGVKLTLISGKKYLIGSGEAPLLAAIISALSAAARGEKQL
jgi:hypothetical protein